MYKPTEKELKELGFTYFETEDYWYLIFQDCEIHYDNVWNNWFIDDMIDLYPSSKKDVLTLIRLLSWKHT